MRYNLGRLYDVLLVAIIVWFCICLSVEIHTQVRCRAVGMEDGEVSLWLTRRCRTHLHSFGKIHYVYTDLDGRVLDSLGYTRRMP